MLRQGLESFLSKAQDILLKKTRAISLNLRKVGQIENAVAANNLFLELYAAEESKPPLTAEGNLAFGLGQLEAAKNHESNDYFSKVLKLAVNPVLRAESHYGLGSIARSLNNTNESLNQFQLALDECENFKTLNPEEYARLKSNILRNRGLTFLKVNDLDNALKDFQESVVVANQYPAALKGFIPAVTAYCALVWGKLGNKEESIAQFKQAKAAYFEFKDALNDSMDFASLFVHKARVYLQWGELEKALNNINMGEELRRKSLLKDANNEGLGDYYIRTRMTDVIKLKDEIIQALKQKYGNAIPQSKLFSMTKVKQTLFPQLENKPEQKVIAVSTKIHQM